MKNNVVLENTVLYNRYNRNGSPKQIIGRMKRFAFKMCMSCRSNDVKITFIQDMPVVNCKCGERRFL